MTISEKYGLFLIVYTVTVVILLCTLRLTYLSAFEDGRDSTCRQYGADSYTEGNCVVDVPYRISVN